MEFTPEQITEIISEITNGEQGFQGLVKQGLEIVFQKVCKSFLFSSLQIYSFLIK